jgi:hypothetical protein
VENSDTNGNKDKNSGSSGVLYMVILFIAFIICGAIYVCYKQRGNDMRSFRSLAYGSKTIKEGNGEAYEPGLFQSIN